jgi:hypothetical protein
MKEVKEIAKGHRIRAGQRRSPNSTGRFRRSNTKGSAG